MSALIIWIGVGVAAIGVVLTTNGLVIYQSTFGNAMATVGGIAFVGGLVVLALGLVHRVLLQISEKLDGAMLPYEPEEDEADEEHHLPEPRAARRPAPAPEPVFAPEPPPAARPAPVAAALAAPVAPPVPAAQPPRREPAPAAPVVASGRPRTTPLAASGALPPQPTVPQPAVLPPASPPAADNALPSWFRRGRDGAAPAAPAEPPMKAPSPPARRVEEPVHEEEDDELPMPVAARTPRPRYEEAADDPREDFPVVVRSGPFNYGLEPEEGGESPDLEPVAPRRAPAVEAPSVQPPAARSAEHEEDSDSAEFPPFLRPTSAPEPEAAGEQHAAQDPAPAPAAPAPSAPRAPRLPTVLKSGFIGGMAYTLYSDGSIEAELPDGVLRFASLQALREHVATTTKAE